MAYERIKQWGKPDCITTTKEKLREQTVSSTCSKYHKYSLEMF